METFESLFNKNLVYTMELGIMAGERDPEKDKEKKKKKKSREKEEKKGLTNAELMFILENGDPLRNLPKRPVLQMAIDYADENLIDKISDAGFEAYLNGGEKALEEELNHWCDRIRDYAKDLITDSPNNPEIPQNAESTIKRKGYNHPLQETGQLKNSITCILVNEKGERV